MWVCAPGPGGKAAVRAAICRRCQVPFVHAFRLGVPRRIDPWASKVMICSWLDRSAGSPLQSKNLSRQTGVCNPQNIPCTGGIMKRTQNIRTVLRLLNQYVPDSDSSAGGVSVRHAPKREHGRNRGRGSEYAGLCPGGDQHRRL